MTFSHPPHLALQLRYCEYRSVQFGFGHSSVTFPLNICSRQVPSFKLANASSSSFTSDTRYLPQQLHSQPTRPFAPPSHNTSFQTTTTPRDPRSLPFIQSPSILYLSLTTCRLVDRVVTIITIAPRLQCNYTNPHHEAPWHEERRVRGRSCSGC